MQDRAKRDRRSGLILMACGMWWVSALTGCGDSEPNGLTLTGVVREFDQATTEGGAPIGEVSVCQFASNNCTVSDDDGRYELRLLFNREVEVAYQKDGFGPVLIGYVTARDDIVGDAVLTTDATLSEFAADLQTPYPPEDSGFITLTAFRGATADDVRIEGASFSLIGSEARSYYVDDDGIPDSSLAVTQSAGTGGFVEVAPIAVTLEVRGTAVNCTSPAAWLADGTNRFRLPIRAGFSTQSTVNCQ